MYAVDEVAATVGVAEACRVLGMPRSSYYRARQTCTAPKPAPKNGLCLTTSRCTLIGVVR